jgi:hypothetical protein
MDCLLASPEKVSAFPLLASGDVEQTALVGLI